MYRDAAARPARRATAQPTSPVPAHARPAGVHLAAAPRAASYWNEGRVGSLQRAAGNQAVASLLTPAVQRREVRTSAEATGPGDWTTADRENNTPRWQAACLANLQAADSSQYVKVVERRDFYKWFYEYSVAKGFETRWALAAYVVANGAHLIADMDDDHRWANDSLGLASVELQGIMREGNQVIFDNVLPKLRDLIAGRELVGKAAIDWDMKILSEEQTLVQPLYKRMSKDTVEQLLYIARKKRFAYVGAVLSGEDEVPAGRYNMPGTVPEFGEPDITYPRDRWRYGMKLGDKFTPGGTGFDPARDRMPRPGDSYLDGSELARVDNRAALHELDAWLNPHRLSRTRGSPGADLPAIVGRLSEPEKEILVRDRSPDGWAYSTRFGDFSFIDEALVRQAMPSALRLRPLVVLFLARYRSARERSELENAPMLMGP